MSLESLVHRRCVGISVVLALGLGGLPVAAAGAEPAWRAVAYTMPAKTSLAAMAEKQYALFKFFLDNSLHGKGKQDFLRVAKQVRNNVRWRDAQGNNAYNAAFRRSWSFVRKVDLQGMPETVLLIPYMESQWDGTKGRKSSDYGYWQLVPEVTREIQALDYAPATLRQAHIDTLRADVALSTKAAQIHLHRYHFYFANVAKFSESDAWLLTFIAYNWGAGNLKRLIAELQAEGKTVDFSSVYHRLYTRHRNNPGDRDLRAAVEYVPSLWHIAQLIRDEN